MENFKKEGVRGLGNIEGHDTVKSDRISDSDGETEYEHDRVLSEFSLVESGFVGHDRNSLTADEKLKLEDLMKSEKLLPEISYGGRNFTLMTKERFSTEIKAANESLHRMLSSDDKAGDYTHQAEFVGAAFNIPVGLGQTAFNGGLVSEIDGYRDDQVDDYYKKYLSLFTESN